MSTHVVPCFVKRFIRCPNCGDGEFSIDHLKLGQKVTQWSCGKCHRYVNIEVGVVNCTVELLSVSETPVCVTLRSTTNPPITVKLNAWKYAHSQKDTPQEYFDHQKYFYESHTCPTNWVDEIEQIECEGDTDPHGLFELVSIEDGHFQDPSDVTLDPKLGQGS